MNVNYPFKILLAWRLYSRNVTEWGQTWICCHSENNLRFLKTLLILPVSVNNVFPKNLYCWFCSVTSLGRVSIFCLGFPMDHGWKLEMDRHCPRKPCLTCPALCLVIRGAQRALCNRWIVSFTIPKWTWLIVSWEKISFYPQHQFKFTLGSQDALVSMSAPIVSSSFCLLELEKRLQPSSLLVPGRLPCIRSSSLKHCMSHLLVFYPTQKGPTLL